MPQQDWFSTRGLRQAACLGLGLQLWEEGQSPREGSLSLSLSLEDGGQPLEGATPGGSPQPNEEPVEKSEQQSTSCVASTSSATINIEIKQCVFSAAKPSLSGRHPRVPTTASKLPTVPQRPRPQCWHPSQPLWSR